MGCGLGRWTREFRILTSGTIVGSDISEEIIKYAKSYATKDIDYYVMDATKPMTEGLIKQNFDIVTAVFLLHYSKDRVELG